MVAAGAATRSTHEVEELRQRYASYRRRQATGLVHLMPREAVRPLLRKARRQVGDGEDSLQMLVRFCESLLPLPPFEVWLEDLYAHPEAHLSDVDESAQAPTVQAPTTVEVRGLRYRGQPWTASLRSYRDGGVWRGYIAFADEAAGLTHRTAPVFCEEDPVTLRERFLSFESPALEAFLRSALP